MRQWAILNCYIIPIVQTYTSCTSRPDVCQCLVVQTPMHNMSRNIPTTSMTHVACESKLRLVVMSSMHPCPGNWVAIGHAVVYHDRAAHAFSSGIKCRHCIPVLPVTPGTRGTGCVPAHPSLLTLLAGDPGPASIHTNN